MLAIAAWIRDSPPAGITLALALIGAILAIGIHISRTIRESPASG